jgi:hypothetical protein
MTDHKPVVHHLPPDGINPAQKVTLCSCGNRNCTLYKESQ